MTKKDYLIDLILSYQIKQKKMINRSFTITVFDVINKRDWKVFCSQMCDYDHPGERIAANEEMERELKELNPGNYDDMQDTIETVRELLKNRDSEIGQYYADNFHSLNEVVSQRKLTK